MARYLITYHGPGMPHDPAAIGQAREAFLAWAQRAGPALVDPGSPIAARRTVGGPAEGPVLGWSVIEAASAQDVADLLADHPFVSRGGSLQINEP
ncbi:MAG: hypothetical protein ACHQZR_05795, partial [Candidatus Limnocylindrales bacterium]